jgi:hypothetical protein
MASLPTLTLTSLTPVTAGPASFYALRLALGVAESGAFPAMWHVCGQVRHSSQLAGQLSMLCNAA